MNLELVEACIKLKILMVDVEARLAVGALVGRCRMRMWKEFWDLPMVELEVADVERGGVSACQGASGGVN